MGHEKRTITNIHTKHDMADLIKPQSTPKCTGHKNLYWTQHMCWSVWISDFFLFVCCVCVYIWDCVFFSDFCCCCFCLFVCLVYSLVHSMLATWQLLGWLLKCCSCALTCRYAVLSFEHIYIHTIYLNRRARLMQMAVISKHIVNSIR